MLFLFMMLYFMALARRALFFFLFFRSVLLQPAVFSWHTRREPVHKHLSITFRNILNGYFTRCLFPTCGAEVDHGSYGDVRRNIDVSFFVTFCIFIECKREKKAC